MTLLRTLSLSLLLLITTLLGACNRKADPAPVAGALKISVVNFDAARNMTYSLYTEAIWAGFRTSSPLREGPLQAELVIDNLNPGNYVFVLDNSTAKSVQVVAGQTIAVSCHL